VSRANEIIPNHGRWRFRLPRPGRRTAIAAGVVAGILALSFGGASYATFRYTQRYEGKILPGSNIAGVDVSGMTRAEALVVVEHAIRPQLTRVVRVTYEDRTWSVTPTELGARSDAADAVDAALSASRDTSFLERMRMQVFGDELGFGREIAITYPRRSVRGFVKGVASSYELEVRDARVDYSTGWVEIVRERAGRDVLERKSGRALMRTLRRGGHEAPLAVKVLKPEVTTAAFDQVLLLRIGENKLYLYEDGEITNEWTVATGQPEYRTPTGLYEVVEKRYMPTWVNPDPTGWGASMPASIPPGPGNPLGVRALNWDAEAIRFHGTSATYSLGYNASHGCVRLSNDEVIGLYDLVDVGTPIVSIEVAPFKPLYGTSAPDPIPVAEDADESSSESDSGSDRKKDNQNG